MNKIDILLKDLWKTNKRGFLTVFTLIYGKKNIGRIMDMHERISKIEKILNNAGYSCKSLKSFQITALNQCLKRKKFLNTKQKRYPISKNSYLYVAKSDSTLRSIIKSEINGNSKLSGILFGYPNCCIESYAQKSFESNIDLYNRTMKDSSIKQDVPFYINCFDSLPVLIHHFPCSWECAASVKIGKSTFELLQSYNNVMAEQCKKNLKKIVFINSQMIIIPKFAGMKTGIKYPIQKFIIFGDVPKKTMLRLLALSNTEAIIEILSNSKDFKRNLSKLDIINYI